MYAEVIRPVIVTYFVKSYFYKFLIIYTIMMLSFPIALY